MKKIFSLIVVLLIVVNVNAQRSKPYQKVNMKFNYGMSTDGQISALMTTGFVTGVGTMYSAFKNSPTYLEPNKTQPTITYVGCAVTGAAITWGVAKIIKKNKKR
jgi:hypothetical protein